MQSRVRSQGFAGSAEVNAIVTTLIRVLNLSTETGVDPEPPRFASPLPR